MDKAITAEVGDAFVEGETWTSPVSEWDHKGTKYHVKEERFPKGGGRRKIAILRTDTGRKIIRAWDAVANWVRYPEDNA